MSRSLLAAAVLLGCLPSLHAAEQIQAAPVRAVSTIYSAQHPAALEQWEENPAIIRRMVDQLLLEVTGQPDIAKAWRSLVAPTDRVGIKVSASGAPYFSTHRGVVEAVVAGLEQAGVPAAQIIVWDRDSADLEKAGFVSRRGGYAVTGIEPATGYDRQAAVTAPFLGKLIWGDLLFQEKQKGKGQRVVDSDQLSSTSHLASVLSRQVTKIINLPVMSDGGGCGIAGALYNVTVPNVDNWRRFTQREGAESIPELYADERIGRRVVLHLMDGLVAQYAGGPRFNPNYAFAWHTLYASKDPVALDAHALRLLEDWRVDARLPPIGRRAAWLEIAAALELGNIQDRRIIVRPVGARE